MFEILIDTIEISVTFFLFQSNSQSQLHSCSIFEWRRQRGISLEILFDVFYQKKFYGSKTFADGSVVYFHAAPSIKHVTYADQMQVCLFHKDRFCHLAQVYHYPNGRVEIIHPNGYRGCQIFGTFAMQFTHYVPYLENRITEAVDRGAKC